MPWCPPWKSSAVSWTCTSMLVFSIHVSCGFETIEKIMEETVGRDADSTWMYGNVYDPADGSTPLNWWQELLKPE